VFSPDLLELEKIMSSNKSLGEMIRLAYHNPELRDKLMPVIKKKKKERSSGGCGCGHEGCDCASEASCDCGEDEEKIEVEVEVEANSKLASMDTGDMIRTAYERPELRDRLMPRIQDRLERKQADLNSDEVEEASTSPSQKRTASTDDDVFQKSGKNFDFSF
jgi:hypothetical protein